MEDLERVKRGEMSQKEVAVKHRCAESYITRIKKGSLPLVEPESMKLLSEEDKRFVFAKVEMKYGADAAEAVYQVQNRNSAKALACMKMKDPLIRASVVELMDMRGLTKDDRIQQLKKLVFSKDGNISLRALDQTWRLDGSFQPLQVDFNVNYDPVGQRQRLAELRQMLAAAEALPDDDSVITITET
jgi:hypothetical protein